MRDLEFSSKVFYKGYYRGVSMGNFMIRTGLRALLIKLS